MNRPQPKAQSMLCDAVILLCRALHSCRKAILILALAICVLLPVTTARRANADESQIPSRRPTQANRADHHSRADRAISLTDERQSSWPSTEQIIRTLTMRDYNTRIVLLGTSLLGICGGIVGTFMLLRRRSLAGDVVSHASLPGIGIAFLIMEIRTPGSGKSLTGLLIGAFLAGLAGILCTTAIRRYSRIKEDAALAIVLSIFFGLGIALFTIIQNIPTGNAAGLNQFIFGKAASIVADDVALIAKAAALALGVCVLLFKEFSLLCFDEEFAAAQGWPVLTLDLLLMTLVVSVTIIGLQSVGLLLVVAMLITPAAAARFWTDHLGKMTLTAGLIGGLSAFLGVLASALSPRLAAGAIIVLMGSCLFSVSLLFGTQRGVIRRMYRYRELKRRVGRSDLLRAIYEYFEGHPGTSVADHGIDFSNQSVTFDQILSMRTWTTARLKRLLHAAERANLLWTDSMESYRLTRLGALEARRAARNHRLWEIYLVKYAEIAPSHVDRAADEIEHVLEPEVLDELDELLARRYPQMIIPPSPHEIGSQRDSEKLISRRHQHRELT